MKVAVIGAGMAGLSASLELEKLGAEVTIFESSDKVGGRIRTKTLGGVLFEEGAEWISPLHLRVLSLIERANLKLETGSNGHYEVWYQGESCHLNQLWDDAHEDWERVQSMSYELSKKVSTMALEGDPLLKLDKISLSEFLDQHCQSVRGRWLLEAYHRSEEAQDTKFVSLLGWLMGLANYQEQGQNEIGSLRIQSGLSACVEFLLSNFSGEVRLNEKVLSLDWNDKRVVVFSDQMEECFDCVVLTVPTDVLLNEIVFNPSLPREKILALSMIGAGRCMKVLLAFKRPFWISQSNGYLMTDAFFQQIWPAVNGQAGLVAYVCGGQAAELSHESDVVYRVIQKLDAFLPGTQQEFVTGSTVYWQPAYSHLLPGSVKTVRNLAEPCGRLHFAGEYAARWLGFVEGALESGERVANEVLAATAVD